MLLWWTELSKTLICFSANVWGWVPFLWVVWPEVTQHWSLQALCWGYWQTPWGYFSEFLLPVSLSSPWATAAPTSAGDLPTVAARYGSVSYGVTAPSTWVLVCTLLCVCPPRVESLFSPVLLKSCNQIPLAFKVWFYGNSSSHCQTPRLGSLTWGSEPSFQWVDFCGIIVLQFVSRPPSGYGIWFYCDCTLLPSHCGFSFVFGCGVSFLVSPESSCWWLFSS